MAIQELWPLFGLRVETPRLLLRYPSDADLAALASHPAGAIHDPATMPFAIPWTDAPPEELARNTLRYYWLGRAYGEQAIHGNLMLRAKLAGRIRRAFERALELDPNNAQVRQNFELFKEINDRTSTGKDL